MCLCVCVCVCVHACACQFTQGEDLDDLVDPELEEDLASLKKLNSVSGSSESDAGTMCVIYWLCIN